MGLLASSRRPLIFTMWMDERSIVALAPMADMTDGPFCRVCREVSGPDFVIFREMVSAEAICRGNAKTLKMCEFDAIERPIVLQLFGAEPKQVRQAAEILVEKFKPDGIDINMGCPVPKLTGKVNSGAALMKDHERAVKIVAELKKADLGAPISVKTRLGWGREEEILEFAPKLEAAGADLLTIHGRTKTQGYSGKANWEMIGRVKKLLKIPALANGDINSSEDIRRCLEITGADGVMIGRGALGNPWIFRCHCERSEATPSDKAGDCFVGLQSPRDDILNVILRHAQLHLERYGEGSMVTFRKHLAYYFKGVPGVKELKMKLMRVKTFDELLLSLRGGA
ncbi:tRNA-dihydrouridine synthase [Patescibacteria group bacterium]|nr:MAG: tRNA-dihydrouridine synthase [Patescibacteria group bacterium]